MMSRRIMAVATLIAVIGMIFWVSRRQIKNSDAPMPPAGAVSSPTVGSEIPFSSDITVQSVPRTVVFPMISVTTQDDYRQILGPGEQVGRLSKGPYEGAYLVRAVFEAPDGPCKGDGCDIPGLTRFILKDKSLIFLSKDSPSDLNYGGWSVWQSTFQALGFSLTSDTQTAVFFHPDVIQVASNVFRALGNDHPCDPTEAAVAGLPVVGQHPYLGSIYQRENGFWAVRPDETCVTLEYQPSFSDKQIRWTQPPSKLSRTGYIWKPRRNAGEPVLDEDPFVSTQAIGGDLKIVGETSRGEPVYELMNGGHPWLRKFFDEYSKNLKDDDSSGVMQFDPFNKKEPMPELTYSDFVAQQPILFWRNPFGRLMRFINADFLPVYMAEPIIYLYPEHQQQVDLFVRPRKAISASTPLYGEGWKVLATPSGDLTDLATKKKYPYLFWEGISGISEMREEGFVVAADEVAPFFRSTLPVLGLNEKETMDFLEAWLPQFKGAPFYFITFFEPKEIDQLARLDVSPKPDTVIRVLMDYRPLNHRETVKRLPLPKAPKRQGFVLVEWGGIQRQKP